MKKYDSMKSGYMDGAGYSNKDYQPSKSEFAGEMPGKANQYMERKEKQMKSDAGKIRSQAYKGRYD